MGGKFWVNSIRLIFLLPNHPSLFIFVILINKCIKKINWPFAHRVSQRVYAHRTCYRFSKSPRYTARARTRTKRCIPVDIQYYSGDRTMVLNRIYPLDVSYGCIRYISVVLIVSCVLLVVVLLQRPYFFFGVGWRTVDSRYWPRFRILCLLYRTYNVWISVNKRLLLPLLLLL